MAYGIDGRSTGQTYNAYSNPRKPSNSAGKNDFLTDFKIVPKSKYKVHRNGLKVAVLKEGSGIPLAKGMRLKVNYTGWLETGKKFDSSVGKGKPFEFTLGTGQVIKGWEEGMAGIKPGERRQLVIPARLGYGNRGTGKIPPNSTLVFNVEAIAVEAAPAGEKSNISVRA